MTTKKEKKNNKLFSIEMNYNKSICHPSTVQKYRKILKIIKDICQKGNRENNFVFFVEIF